LVYGKPGRRPRRRVLGLFMRALECFCGGALRDSLVPVASYLRWISATAECEEPLGV
jgi:hypothetical protein